MRIGAEAGPPPAPPASSGLPEPSPDAPSAFGTLLERVAGRIDAGEALVERALRGSHRGLEPTQWVALQAGIYRYVEAVDLAGKVVDRTGNAIRTVLGGNH